MKLIDHLQWRYATKRFDKSKSITTENLVKLKECIQLSASSYGLQLYKILIIQDKETRERLKKVSWNQNQITEASHLFVFCNYTQVNKKHIDDYQALKFDFHKGDSDKYIEYGKQLLELINEKTTDELAHWTSRQTYLALGNLLAACAELKIDACPMEGFDPYAYNEILGLKTLGLNAAVITAVGYRSDQDHTQYAKKIRKSLDTLFEMI